MAKRGMGNERDNAERLLRKICKKRNLDYDFVLNDLLIEEFEFNYENHGISKKLCIQVLARYAMMEGDRSYCLYKYVKKISIKTTAEKWADFLSAVDVIAREYKSQRKEMVDRQKRERKMFFTAFLNRNDLFYPYPFESEKKQKNKISSEDLEAMADLARNMDEVQVARQIEDGSNASE